MMFKSVHTTCRGLAPPGTRVSRVCSEGMRPSQRHKRSIGRTPQVGMPPHLEIRKQTIRAVAVSKDLERRSGCI